MKTTAIVLFILTYVLLLSLPKHRAKIALATATIFVALGILPFSKVFTTVDWNVILMIAGTMGLVSLFIDSKMPSLLADFIIAKTPNVKWAIVSLSLFAGIISAFVDNVATVLMVAPVALTICKKLNVSPVSSIIAISVASNLQGAATLAGGNVVHYVCDEKSDWIPDIADIKRKITQRTKALVVINPNNPTGALYGVDVLEQLAQIARENNLIIFADEIYDRLLMDGGSHTSIAALAPDLCVVTLNGLSKSHLIAGYRCGWMSISGNKESAKSYIEGLNMLSSMRLCSNVPAQRAIKPALENLDSSDYLLKPGGRIYEQRETICRALDKIDGITYVRPKSAFYVFPKIDAKRFNITSDEQFVLDFLREKQVLLVHGGGFHWEAPDHFRIVYLPEPSILEESMEKLGDFLKTYRQA